MKKIEYCLYQLETTASPRGQREGALLRVHFEEGSVGYADCHPWQELGDLPLDEQMKNLQHHQPTTLGVCSLHFARLDGNARERGEPLLIEKELSQSHFLVTDFLPFQKEDLQRISEQGFSHLKIKLGRDISMEAKHLLELFTGSSIKLRLDFNENLTENLFLKFLEQVEGLKPLMDFIEDPFPYDSIAWEKIQKKGWTLACDRQALKAKGDPDAAKVIVIKPAIVAEAEWKGITNQRKVVTSYLDHPLGQMSAVYAASVIDPQRSEVHGLQSHYAYLPTPFSQKLSSAGPHFRVPQGNGFGFEFELKGLPWKTLR